MNAFLQITYDQLERQRGQVMNQLRPVSADAYQHSPAPGNWSISQVMTHIITAERMSLGYMKKKAQGIDQLPDSGTAESLRLLLLIATQRLPLKFKAPRTVVENTPQAWTFEEMTAQWEAVRQELAAFLEGIDDRHVRRQLYKHPIAGRLNVRQAMVFFSEHIIHHQPQLNRLLKAVRK
jgi:uncharacterized damage-inducible protein DinB